MFLLVLLMSVANAADQWFCTEASSARSGNVVQACGLGLGTSESKARAEAFDNATEEFRRICELSSDCRGHRVSLTPKRTTCKRMLDGLKCYRMVEFTILPEMQTADQTFNTNEFITRDMPKQKMLRILGDPHHIYRSGSTVNFVYKGTICVNEGRCEVTLFKNKVYSWDYIKPQLTDDLR